MRKFFFKTRLLWRFWKILSRGEFVLGREVALFERRLRGFFRLKHALGVASGTDALVLSLKAAAIGPGDEVIVPALGFFSTAGAVSWVNAKPVFVDSTLPTMQMDAALIEQAITPRTRAIIIAHLNGVVTDISRIADIAEKHNLILIEDYAQAFGVHFSSRKIVRYGDIVCLSFNPTKIVHAYGDGGAILTNSDEIAEKVRLMRMYGTTVRGLGRQHHIVGVASRLSIWSAAALNLQLDTLERIVRKRREKFFLYLKYLRGIKGVMLPQYMTEKDCVVTGYRFVILTEKRDELFNYLKRHGVDVQVNYGMALPLMVAFSSLGYVSGDFPIAEKVSREALTLPSDESLAEKDILRITGWIRSF